MPYIEPSEREELAQGKPILKPGRLNYLLTRLLIQYWRNSPRNYQAINDIIGALEGAKLEFYRRVAVPYENQKIKMNGDVFE